MDELHEIKQRLAYQVFKETGNTNAAQNWEEATRILNHFVDRHPESPEWMEQGRLLRRYRDLIYS